MNNKRNTILVADTDDHIHKLISIILNQDIFTVIESNTGKQAMCYVMSARPDLILLDDALPDISAITFIETLRGWSKIPVIVLSKSLNDKDIVNTLNAGANDYVGKPFNGEVLAARIQAALRTSITIENGEHQLVNGALRIDLIRHEVFLNGQLLSFTPKEYNLLSYFMKNKGKMLLHNDILKDVWGTGYFDNIQYLRVFVGHIREKIESDPAKPKYIITEVGVGYRMEHIEDNDFDYQQSLLFA